MYELYHHPPNTPSWRSAQLEHRDNFTFTLPPIYVQVSQVLFSLKVFDHNFICVSLASSMDSACLAHLILLDLVTIIKFGKLYMQFYSASCYIHFIWSKYSLQSTVPHPYKQHVPPNCTILYLNLYVFRYGMGRQSILN
jgi:hypothetical protein